MNSMSAQVTENYFTETDPEILNLLLEILKLNKVIKKKRRRRIMGVILFYLTNKHCFYIGNGGSRKTNKRQQLISDLKTIQQRTGKRKQNSLSAYHQKLRKQKLSSNAQQLVRYRMHQRKTK